MNYLHKQMLPLFNDDEGLKSDLLAAPAYTLPERRKLAANHAKRLYPKCPKGCGYAPKTFWRIMADNRLFHVAFCGSAQKQEKLAAFIEQYRAKHPIVWPPMAFPVKYTPQPTPWDGR